MTEITQATSAYGVRPGSPAPELAVATLAGDYALSDRQPERFSMPLFFRGLHCPVCQAQLRELDRRLDDLTARGIDVIAVSGETRERTAELQRAWGLKRLPIGYGLSEEQMRAWGLFVSRGVSEGEPPLFNEPALFLIDRGGLVYYESILSMPVGRPRLDDLLAGIDYWTEHRYPARGGA